MNVFCRLNTVHSWINYAFSSTNYFGELCAYYGVLCCSGLCIADFEGGLV